MHLYRALRALPVRKRCDEEDDEQPDIEKIRVMMTMMMTATRVQMEVQ